MYEYKVLIPKVRRNVLIKDNYKNKKLIEEQLSVNIELTDEEVIIKSEDSYSGWVCENVIKAIGRGFTAKQSLRLLNEDYALEIIDISDYAKTKNSMIRLRGRLIGDQGRAKRHLEKMTGCSISVHGKTVSIICDLNIISIARNAIQMILEGSKHSTAYRYIEKQLRKMP